MLGAVALASLALVCHGQHAPLTFEEKRQGALEYYAETRASFGFRSDLPYVQELIRRNRWEYDVGDFPATKAENRYLRLRDRARHHAALRRIARFPDNLRTIRVRRSERQLRRLAHRIGRDDRELRAAGFQLSSWGADIVSNTVEVELITARTDHAEYFARRYGPVTTNVIATEPTRLECSEADAYEISPDGNGLVLHWGSGSSRDFS